MVDHHDMRFESSHENDALPLRGNNNSRAENCDQLSSNETRANLASLRDNVGFEVYVSR